MIRQLGEIAGQLVKDGEVTDERPILQGAAVLSAWLETRELKKAEAESQYGRCWDCG